MWLAMCKHNWIAEVDQMNFDDGVMIMLPSGAFGTPVGQAQNLVVRTLQRQG